MIDPTRTKEALVANERSIVSLPDVVGEETVISLQKVVSGAKKSVEGLFIRREIKKGRLLYKIGSVPDALYMLRGGIIRLMPVASRSVEAMPVTTIYHASPGQNSNRPLLGARYFFSRNRCTLEYLAETPCTVYEITSGALNDLHDADRQSVLLMMYWLIASSDISDVFVPIANKALGLQQASVGDTQGLLRAVEEFRAARDNPKMPGLLYKLYKSFMARRIESAARLGIEPSIVQLAPTDRSI